jgi:hypothetical protein
VGIGGTGDKVQDGSSTTPLQGMTTRVEPDADDAPLGTVSVGWMGQTLSQVTMPEVCITNVGVS